MVAEERTPGTTRTEQDGGTVLGEVRLRHLPEFHAVVLTTRGPYADVTEKATHLRSWAEAVGVLPTGDLVSIFYERAWVTGEVTRYSLCLPTSRNEADLARTALAGSAEDQGMDVREIPRTLVAGVFYRGPAERQPAAFERVKAWIGERPYLAAGAPRAIHLAEPGVLTDGMVEVEIQQPVVPRPR